MSPSGRSAAEHTGTDPYVPGHGDASFDVRHYDLDLADRKSVV